ncbi:MAG TPA: PIG-L family deacetylase [Actinomycetota bacterium]|nr:PIG-L family deacetylase [Actinomycetota bacterium]
MALTLMAVHAHPDDEAIGTGGILARAAAEGIRTVVVTCTNGEYGDGPGGVKPGQEGHDPEAVAKVRKAELEAACRALNVTHLEMLGYHDSGMVDWEYKANQGVFARVPLEEATQRLAALFEHYRPDVVVTYEEESAYDHPDHVQTARVTLATAKATGIPRKLYLTALSLKNWQKLATMMQERGIESPFSDPDPAWVERLQASEAKITTAVDVKAYAQAKRAAVQAHASQMDESFFNKLPPDLFDFAFGEETFIRASDTTGVPVPEVDLFAGLR